MCLKSNYGSITHFYHFFYGVLVPLILVHLENKKDLFNIYGDTGPMIKILYEMPFTIKVLQHIPKDCYDLVPLDSFKSKFINKRITLLYSEKIKICDFFEKNVPFYLKELNFKDIVLIERNIDPSYKHIDYSKQHFELQKMGKLSGKDRRYIINHEEIVDYLKSNFSDNFINVSLERTSIYYQYLLFKNAKIIIASHGAGLSNVIFMKENTCVIEIISKEKLNKEKEDTFKNLSLFCKLKHKFIITEKEIDIIDILKLKKTIETFI
jgi:hypothetical protein